MEQDLVILGRVGLAMLFGAILGLDREMAQKPAGLRTHMLVAGTSCLFISIGMLLQGFYAQAYIEAGRSDEINIVSDPVRIIEAIITGISFLGAGTIMRSNNDSRVEGLTTAATILLAAALGVLVGVDRWMLAGGITLLAIITIQGLRVVTERIERRVKQA